MLFQQFELTVAHFPTLEAVQENEVSQADLVQIDTFVTGGIYHSQQLNWKGDLTFIDHPEDFLRSDKERKTLAQSKAFFLEQGYEIRVTQIDDEHNRRFMEVYKKTTLQRNRAIDFNAELIVKKNLASDVPVWLFGLYLHNELESGLLVSQVKDEMRVMFGAKKRFDQIRGGIGGVLEMELLKFCFDQGIKKISHGLSTNPAGFVDSAGIFEFKSRYGFSAFPLGEWKTTFILKEQVAMSDLVFVVADGKQLGLHILAKEELPHTSKYASKAIQNAQVELLSDHIHRAKKLLHLHD